MRRPAQREISLLFVHHARPRLPYQKLIDLYLLDCPALVAPACPEPRRGFFILSEVEDPRIVGVPTMCVGKPGIFLSCAKKRKKLRRPSPRRPQRRRTLRYSV